MPDFSIPAVLQDLEGEPYHLQPYPPDFDDANRDDAFGAMVDQLAAQNRLLAAGVYPDDVLDEEEEDAEEESSQVLDPWLDFQRLQSLYTLVRKSPSLSKDTRQNLVATLCEAVRLLMRILRKAAGTVSPACRDAFVVHLYMLYSCMFLLESQIKADTLTNAGTSKADAAVLEQRSNGMETLLDATIIMDECRKNIWQRGVVDEQVVLIPCKIAYVLLERSTGIVARRTFGATPAMEILTRTVQAHPTLLTHVVASVWDMLHNHEHMAALVAELGTSNHGAFLLTQEMLKEYGRLDGSGDPKMTGVKLVAPWVGLVAERRPDWVLPHLAHIVGHLTHSEAYPLRSAVVTALAAILLRQKTGAVTEEEEDKAQDQDDENAPEETPAVAITTKLSPTTRDQILQLLVTQAHDVSSYTRAAVLKAWGRLVAHRVLPKGWIQRVTKLALERLSDKTVVVRKQSMQLLTHLLEHNPFGGNLDPSPYRRKLAELYDYLKENLPAHIREAQDTAMQEAQDDEEAQREIERATLATVLSEITEEPSDGEENQVSETYRNNVQALRFTQAALDFIDVLEESTKAFEGMLLSANTSDVTEALHFFVQARHFSLPCAVTGMKRALALMWSSEKAIRDEVLKAFVDVFIAQPGSEGKVYLSEKDIARNLLVLTGQASLSELASIEEAITCLVREERIPPDVFLILWSIASKGSADARKAALQLIAMGAAADQSLVDSKSRLKLLYDSCLGDFMRERNDWALAAAGTVVLQRVSRGKVDPSDAKYLVMERIIEELQVVVGGENCRDDSEDDTRRWFSASENAIKALFTISPEPEAVCKEVIHTMQSKLFGGDSCSDLQLARFFHVLGHVSLNLLVYTESLAAGVRRANAKKSLHKQEQADKAKALSNGKENPDDAMEDELGMAAELEAENERQIADISENEILGRGLISVFGPLLIRVVGNEGGKFDSEILRQASALALCKFMCVSRNFCEQHLPLLFTALTNAPAEDVTMRANTIVSLGDLAFRFPNELEPYTPRIYACLRDSSTKVRRHTMMCLTHLILNDMIKVKGNVCEIALCLRDEDPRIRDTARLLFHELSKRSNNPVYNLLPDIVSQLSQRENARDDFRHIMAFLLSYIKKERQNDMLVEKLLQRFEKCTTIMQKADLAYCLTLLKVSEKSIKYLAENFKSYKDALHDDDVRKAFFSMVTKAKKNLKPELREFVEEWETKLNEMAEAGAENEELDAQAGKARARARKQAKRTNGGKLSAKDNDQATKTPGKARPTPRRTRRAAAKTKGVEESSDDEEDMEFDSDEGAVEKENAVGVRAKPQRRGTRRVIAETEED